MERIKQKLLRVEEESDKVQVGGASIPLPRMISWLDSRFEPVRGEIDIPALGKIILYRTTREVAQSFPDQPSVDYLRRIGIKTVIVLKGAAGQDHAKAAAPDPSAGALGIRWQDYGDTVVYTLS